MLACLTAPRTDVPDMTDMTAMRGVSPQRIRNAKIAANADSPGSRAISALPSVAAPPPSGEPCAMRRSAIACSSSGRRLTKNAARPRSGNGRVQSASCLASRERTKSPPSK
eukprot:CAMPEP_0179843310 /NCGR_PEP_ID=MMETSP0982-20121206/3629_1 /TAXON_ID=483367 /ORGANISM="non described non described, Strain CCMP 2436" /LENGTH=110 /DNA_ID=CAMNT_0021727715 /DNA_START=322 /DNA_END=654 /DNA_ORIENTATION=+